MQSHARLSETLAAIPRMFKSSATFRRRNGVFQHSRLACGTAPDSQAPPASPRPAGQRQRRQPPADAAAARRRAIPLTPGYVKATELPDGEVPPVNANGNFIIGPTHPPSPDTAEKEGVAKGTVQNFTMSSADSKIYPGVARQPGDADRKIPPTPRN